VFCDPKGKGGGSGGGKVRRSSDRRRNLLQSGIPVGTDVTFDYEYEIDNSNMEMTVSSFSVHGWPSFSETNVKDLMAQVMARTD
jgi:hypothetical protein